MSHPTEPNEFDEVFCNELGAVVGDDARRRTGELFFGFLQDDFHVLLRHAGSNIPINYVTTEPVENAAKVEERAADVDRRDIHVPMPVRPGGLFEAFSLLRRLAIRISKDSCFLENPVDAARTGGDHVRIQHHVGQTTISFVRMLFVEMENGLLFPVLEP